MQNREDQSREGVCMWNCVCLLVDACLCSMPTSLSWLRALSLPLIPMHLRCDPQAFPRAWTPSTTQASHLGLAELLVAVVWEETRLAPSLATWCDYRTSSV